MAIASCDVKIISRSTGRSSVAAAAYRSGEQLHNEREDTTYAYSRKRGIVYTELLTPSNAPEWAKDREKLWNAVEHIEKQHNAQTAREVEIALPRELSRDQNIALARAYAQTFVNDGMCADLCIHDKGDGNPHAHIMLTMRAFSPEGEWLAKCRKEYILDENGEKIKLKSGEYKSRRVDTVDWDKKENVPLWRHVYEQVTNYHLAKAGRPERIDVRSYEEQGIDKTPTIHLGVAAHHMEQRGIQTERGDTNRAIETKNRELEQTNNEIEVVGQALRREQEARQVDLAKEQQMNKDDHSDTRNVIQQAKLEAEQRVAREREEAVRQEQEAQRSANIKELEQQFANWKEQAQQALQKQAQEQFSVQSQHQDIGKATREQEVARQEVQAKQRELEALAVRKVAERQHQIRQQGEAKRQLELQRMEKEKEQHRHHEHKSLYERLAQEQAEQQRAGELEAQRQAALQRLNAKFFEKLAQYYEPATPEQPEQPAKTESEKQPFPERRLGQPREFTLEEQTRLLMESGNPSIAKFGLDAVARKMAFERELLERAQKLDEAKNELTPLRETIEAIRPEPTPLWDTLQAIREQSAKGEAERKAAQERHMQQRAEQQPQQTLPEQQHPEHHKLERRSTLFEELFAQKTKEYYEQQEQEHEKDDQEYE